MLTKDGKPFTEAAEQQAFCRWLDDHNVCYYAIPNGIYSNSRSVGIAKYRGLKPGVPDLCIAEPTKDYCALYVEMKVMKHKDTQPRVSKVQKYWLDLLNAKGFRAVVAYGAEEAIAIASEYLGVNNED